MQNPKLLILGHARHGKDTFAELLHDRHGLTFHGSSLFAAEVAVRPHLARLGIVYDTVEHCYADRHNHRAAWFDAITAYNSRDRARLAKEILDVADCYVGMRSADEYAASRHLFDLVVWVDAARRGKPAEPRSSMSIRFDPREMVHIDNSGTKRQLASTATWLMGNWQEIRGALAA